MPRHDRLRNFRFRVEIDGLADAAFSEVTIGAISVDVIEYRDGNEPTAPCAVRHRRPPRA